MFKRGRPALSLKERRIKRCESVKRARAKRKQIEKDRRQNGLCRACGESVCAKSKIFCDKHLKNNRSKKIIFSILKSNAKRRHIDFFFTIDSFNAWLANQNKCCHYCGVSPEHLLLTGRNNSKLTIDRMNNQIGYSEKNVCLACFRCNTLKSDFFTYEQWLKIANDYIKPRIFEFHKVAHNENISAVY